MFLPTFKQRTSSSTPL